MVKIIVFDLLYQRAKSLFDGFQDVLVVTPSIDKKYNHIFLTNIKIIYDRNLSCERKDAHNIMNIMIEKGCEFETDALFKFVKDSDGNTVKKPLPQDRIILKYKIDDEDKITDGGESLYSKCKVLTS